FEEKTQCGWQPKAASETQLCAPRQSPRWRSTSTSGSGKRRAQSRHQCKQLSTKCAISVTTCTWHAVGHMVVQRQGRLTQVRSKRRRGVRRGQTEIRARSVAAQRLRANTSLNYRTHYGSRRLAAPGHGTNCPSAAKRRLPPRSG